MTRGKWVALAVGVAVIAVLVHYGPALWRAVAYVESRHDGELMMMRFDTRTYERPQNPSRYIIVTRKRFNWLPGRAATVHCGWCVESAHQKCPGDQYNLFSPKGEWPRWPSETRTCTCPHASHAQESE